MIFKFCCHLVYQLASCLAIKLFLLSVWLLFICIHKHLCIIILKMTACFYILTATMAMRNLKIKTSTCKRIVKELHSYEKEVERETVKVADMKDKGADPYDLKQQVLHMI